MDGLIDYCILKHKEKKEGIAKEESASKRAKRDAGTDQATKRDSIFITNLPSSTTKAGLEDLLLSRSNFHASKITMGTDAASGAFQGWAVCGFIDSHEFLSRVISHIDRIEWNGRVLYCSKFDPSNKTIVFSLGEIERSRILQLRAADQDLSQKHLKDKYKETFGEELNYGKFGFKSFKAAIESIEGNLQGSEE
jgi:RNA recognition motif-containing protein